MKFQFDPNQEYQIKAISSIVSIFEGQSKTESFSKSDGALLGIYRNTLNLTDEDVLKNVSKIQEDNKIKNGEQIKDFDFSVEMETGTGKTYVYLRTIFELNKSYGWKKFIILVPSIAIKEGVLKTLKVTKTHFAELYDNVPTRYYEYHSKNISQVRHFASSNNIEIMVMTVGAFNKDANVLYSERDQMSGEQPISFIQQTNPILILDEPQNMEGDATKEKLAKFNSLFRLRYSATHKNTYNLIYQLSPSDAYQMGLVKKIEVFSVVDDGETPTAYIKLLSTEATSSGPKASVEVFARDDNGNAKLKKISIKQNDDLRIKTNNPLYTGYIVDGLNVEAPDYGSFGSIKFRNTIEVKQGEDTGVSKDNTFRQQIQETIRLHFEKRSKLKEKGIKVLSLFFIDKVSNYAKSDGIIRTLFIEEFNKLKSQYNLDLDTDKVHKGYFALKNGEYLERDKSIEENKEAYDLIMQEKEQLLSFSEPTEFIFSHSALKEGWDNPNVFNICTLNNTTSTMKKRQEIGRGMRICVNQNGERVFEKAVNLLSVVANESYSDYVSRLQSEFVADGIYKAPPAPSNAKRKIKVKLKKDFEKDDNFVGLWQNISKKTRFLVKIDTEKLISVCADRIKTIDIPKPAIKVERIGIDISKEKVSHVVIGGNRIVSSQETINFDIVSRIKQETKLTKETIIKILLGADNTKSLFNNHERFTYEVIKILREEMSKAFVDQIEYEVTGDSFNTDLFENAESYKDSVQPIKNSIYDAVVFDSEVERNFALGLDSDERIKLFIKLPNWFKVNTPVGDYNPDWAIVTVKRDSSGTESGEKIYFVIETKGDVNNLRPSEQSKIKSATKHFEVIGVKYHAVNTYEDFIEKYRLSSNGNK
jgi:type III restriction enzyme